MTVVSLVGIVLLLISIYLPAIHGPFVLDDFSNLPQTNQPLNSLSDLVAVALANESGPLGRPMSIVTFALNHHFWGAGSTSFKITNLLIHVVNTILVFFLSRALLQYIGNARISNTAQNSNIIALAICLLWAIHPLQVSTVVYVVQRMTLLMTFFCLFAMLLYVVARRRYLDRMPGGIAAICGVLVFAVLSILSKENGALLPIYILVLEVCVFRFRMCSNRQSRLFQRSFIAATVAGFACVAAYFLVTPEYLANGYSLREFTLLERLMTQLVVVTHYLNSIFIPDVSGFTVYQDTFPVSRLIGMQEILSALTLGSLLLVAWCIRLHQPLVAFGILFYFASQIMESTVLPLEIAFEHRNYVGSIGLVVSFVCAFIWLLQLTRSVKISYILLPAVTLLLVMQSSIMASEWKTEMSLASASVHKKPASVRARISLATAYMNAKRPDKAIQTLDEFTATQPEVLVTQLMAFYIQTVHGFNEPQRAISIERQLRGSSISMDVVSALDNLSDVYERLPKDQPVRRQILGFLEVASMSEEMNISDRSQAVLHARYSEILMSEGKFELAVSAIQRAANLNSSNREIKLLFAEAMASVSDWQKVSDLLMELENNATNFGNVIMDREFQKRLANLNERMNVEQSTSAEFTDTY